MAQLNCIVGIDPGRSGGIAIWTDSGVEVHKMPATEMDMYSILCHIPGSTRTGCGAVAFVEKVHASPQMGVVSAFKFGRSVGEIHMMCIALGMRLEYVTPQKWQKHFGLILSGRGLGQRNTDKKNRNKARAQELFPGIKCTHATADALLILEYGRQQYRLNPYLDETSKCEK